MEYIDTCDICGHPLPEKAVIDESRSGEIRLICHACAQPPMCRTCTAVSECAFATDKSCAEPPYVIKQVRQGNMIAQTQIRNPKRIAATCAYCRCYWPEGLSDGNHCLKEMGCGCNNYKTAWRNSPPHP